jgi:uncharacterized protein (TIGR02246 family)
MSGELEPLVQRLRDESDIRELMLMFVRGLDDRDWDAYANTFAEDGEFEIMGQRRVGRLEIAAGPERDLTKFDRTQHYSTNHRIELDGDRARASHDLLAIHIPDGARPTEHADIGGRYVCECRRTSAGWRFSEVRLEIFWTRGIEFELEHASASTE